MFKFAFQSIIAYFSHSIITLLQYIVGLESNSSADLTRGSCKKNQLGRDWFCQKPQSW